MAGIMKKMVSLIISRTKDTGAVMTLWSRMPNSPGNSCCRFIHCEAFALLCGGLLFIGSATAKITCTSGCTDTYTSITQTLSSGENIVGKTISSSNVSISANQTTGYSAGKAQEFLYYIGDSIPAAGSSPTSWQYKRIDDYISVALKYTGVCRTLYAPYNVYVFNANTCSPYEYTSGATVSPAPSTFQSQIRIDKKMVGGAYSANIAYANTGRCQPVGCNNLEVSTGKVYLNVLITVPQSCEINAGQMILVDFGTIPSGRFNTAGARPDGVNPITKNLNIKCTNVAEQAQMTLRVQADTASGSAITSDNPDVGFVVADSSGNPLTPNDTYSTIPFTLDDSDSPSASVTIQVYPVSITGDIPVEGKVTSLAYLRVDFD